MNTLTTAQILAITDYMGLHYLTLRDASNAGLQSALNVKTSFLGILNDELTQRMIGPLIRLKNVSGSADWAKSIYYMPISSLQSALSASAPLPTSGNLDTLASYYNGLTPYSCLYSQGFSELYTAATGTVLSAGNIMAEGGCGLLPKPPSVNLTSLATPTVAPTVAQGTDNTGDFKAGVWKVGYTYLTPSGETALSPITTYTLTADWQTLNVTVPSASAGSRGSVIYVSQTPGSAIQRAAAVSVNGGIVIIPNPPSTGIMIVTSGYSSVRVNARHASAWNNSGVLAWCETPENRYATLPYAPSILEAVVTSPITGTGTLSLQSTMNDTSGASQVRTATILNAGVGLVEGSRFLLGNVGERWKKITNLALTGTGTLTGGSISVGEILER